MKQTAVEWLYERLERMISRTELYNIDKKHYLEEAKRIEKEQIIKANRDGVDMVVDGKPFISGEGYYQETFKED
jgi:hypothetical protein